MNRVLLSQLGQLISSAEGTYTLPREVLDAWRVLDTIRSIEIPQPERLDAEVAARQAVAAVAAGETVDALVLGRKVEASIADGKAADRARAVLDFAVDAASNDAALVVDGSVEQIITEHLRPALMAVYDDARELSAVLDGHDLTDTARAPHGASQGARCVRPAARPRRPQASHLLGQTLGQLCTCTGYMAVVHLDKQIGHNNR